MEEFENTWCCMEAEQDIIWSKEFLYKKNAPTKDKIEIEEEDFEIPF